MSQDYFLSGLRIIWHGSGSSILGWIPYRSGSGSNLDPGVLVTKNWNKFTAEIFFFFFWAKTTNYLILALHKGRPSYKRSRQISKENIQHFKSWNCFFSNFTGNFCLPGSGSRFRIRIRIHWPDWNRIQLGAGSTTLFYYWIFVSLSCEFWLCLFDARNQTQNYHNWSLKDGLW